MSTLDDIDMKDKTPAGPFGPDNPAPPPLGMPPSSPQSLSDRGRELHQRREHQHGHRGRRSSPASSSRSRSRSPSGKWQGEIKPEPTEYDKPIQDRGLDLYQRRGYSRGRHGTRPSQASSFFDYNEERRGRQRSSSRDYRDERSERYYYRVRSPRYKRGASSRPYSPVRRTGEDDRTNGRTHSRDARRRSRSRPRSDLDREYKRTYKKDREYKHGYDMNREYNGLYAQDEYAAHRRNPSNRSQTPVTVREGRIEGTKVPWTAYSLRNYTNYINDKHGYRRPASSETRHLPVFRNGDGKVNPSAYGSVLHFDFGLCYSTFKTAYMCEMGAKCPWRHHPLSQEEKDWIVEIAGEKGKKFIEKADAHWHSPDTPLPGWNMIAVTHDRRFLRRD